MHPLTWFIRFEITSLDESSVFSFFSVAILSGQSLAGMGEAYKAGITQFNSIREVSPQLLSTLLMWSLKLSAPDHSLGETDAHKR